MVGFTPYTPLHPLCIEGRITIPKALFRKRYIAIVLLSIIPKEEDLGLTLEDWFRLEDTTATPSIAKSWACLFQEARDLVYPLSIALFLIHKQIH
jgi:hypothetical protein